MRRSIVGAVAAAVVALTGAGCSDAEDAASSAGEQAESAVQSATEQATDAGGAATEQVQQQIDELLQANPVTFTPESAELTDQNRQTLQEMAAVLTAAGAKVTVETHSGHADPQQAQALSQQRAEAISQALQQQGVTPEQITANATGNTTAQGDEALQTQFRVTP